MIEPKVIQHTWWQDSKKRLWVILQVMPFFPTETEKTILMLQAGKMEAIERPYQEIITLIKEGNFNPISY